MNQNEQAEAHLATAIANGYTVEICDLEVNVQRENRRVVLRPNPELRDRLTKLEGDDDHPENRCDRCGGRNKCWN